MKSEVKELQPASKYTVHCSQGWGNQQGRTRCTDAHVEVAISGSTDDAHEVAMWGPAGKGLGARMHRWVHGCSDVGTLLLGGLMSELIFLVWRDCLLSAFRKGVDPVTGRTANRECLQIPLVLATK